MGLFRDRSITDIVSKLDLHLSDSLGDNVAPSAIPQARQRLSDEPLAELFSMTARHWGKQEDSDDKWNNLKLFSIDGTQLRCHDTPEHVASFGYINYSKDKHTEYPIVRLCALTSLRNRIIHDELLWCAMGTPGSMPKKLRAMRERVKRYILPEKIKRPKNRSVRISKTRYLVQSIHP